VGSFWRAELISYCQGNNSLLEKPYYLAKQKPHKNFSIFTLLQEKEGKMEKTGFINVKCYKKCRIM